MHCSVRTKIEILIVLTVNVLILRNLQEQVKKHSVSKIGLTFNCLIEWIENSDLKKIFSHRRIQQLWQQNPDINSVLFYKKLY